MSSDRSRGGGVIVSSPTLSVANYVCFVVIDLRLIPVGQD